MQMVLKISTLVVLSLITTLTVQRWTLPDIKDAVAKDMGCVELRSETSIKLYAELRKKIASENITLPTYIENQKFGYDGQAVAPIYQLFNITSGDQEFAVYILTDEPAELGWISYPLEQEYSVAGLSKQINFLLFTVNDFPYELVEGIQHWLVWSNREIQLDFVNTIINEVLSKQFEHFAFVNPPAKKSIPQIYHAQIFIQKRAEVSQQL